MKLDLLDVDEFVEINHLQEITSSILFQRGTIPDPKGLVSNEIFGLTTRDRKTTFAYIDLHGHYLQPHIYKVLKALFSNIDNIINGSEYYSIKDGKLVRDEMGDTGLEFLYNNWSKLKWEQNEGKIGIRNERIDLINGTKRNVIFMTKQIVIPAFYRDILTSSSGGGGGETSELNNLYANIIRFASTTKDDGMFDFSFYASAYSIQQNINNIYNYFKEKLEKKQGLFRKYLMGKTVDNAVRSVITAPTFHADTPEDMITSYEYTGVPIAEVCSSCYPFVFQWVKNFFDAEFIQNKYTKISWDPATNSINNGLIQLDNPETYFSDKYIEKMINNFIKNPESRFEPIELPVTGNKKKYVAFTGMLYHADSKEDVSPIANRRMTVTDLLYMACEDVTRDKHCLITRYPLLDAFGVFINKIRVISTTQTVPMYVNEKLYKWYPKIEPDTPPVEIGTKFIDALQFSNAFLKGLDGDCDTPS